MSAAEICFVIALVLVAVTHAWAGLVQIYEAGRRAGRKETDETTAGLLEACEKTIYVLNTQKRIEDAELLDLLNKVGEAYCRARGTMWSRPSFVSKLEKVTDTP